VEFDAFALVLHPTGPIEARLYGAVARIEALAARRAATEPVGESAADLLNEKLPEQTWAVPKLLPDGVTILAGPPKAGKSWMVLDLGIAVASGGTALGQFAVGQAGGVAYLALEDSRRRLQSRLKKLLPPGAAAPAGLRLIHKWTKGRGWVQRVEQYLKQNPTIKLLMVDTLARVRESSSKNGNVYLEDYEAIRGIQQMATERQVAVVIVHHTRKGQLAEEGDPLEQVSGTLGLTGCADAVMVLQHRRTSPDGKLFITGRDIEERTLLLKWDSAACSWTSLGEEDVEDPKTGLLPGMCKVLELLEDKGVPMTPAGIFEGVTAAPYNVTAAYQTVWKWVCRLQKCGRLRKLQHGSYALASNEPPTVSKAGEVGEMEK
jgi:hypothetical protein